MKARFLLLTIAMLGTTMMWSATLEQAKSAYNKGDYAKALPMMMEQHKKSPKNGSVCHWLGVCLYKTGEVSKSKEYFELAASRNVAEANRYLALISYDKYDFDAAEEYLDKYEQALAKAKKPTDDIDSLRRCVNKAKLMIDHVEKIVIIDSVSVDRDKFLNAYNMSRGCGSIGNADMLPNGFDRKDVSTVYASESGERMLWSKKCGDKSYIFESLRLINGWDDATKLDSRLNDDGNAVFPFLMQDGLTLYYACDGNGSIGGYDIYMTRKDMESGEYYMPQNIGMPYNSPYDDYMLVIDEEKNVGWWATDRNQIPGKITIYTFIPNPSRVNYSSDDTDIASRAAVKRYRDTWEGKNYSAIAQEVNSLSTNALSSIKEFAFSVYNGVVYHSFSDFKTPAGAQMMEELLVMKKRFDGNQKRLSQLRKQYENASASEQKTLRSNILQLENAIDKSRQDIKWMENSIRKAERN